MKQNDERQYEGQKIFVGISPLYLGRAMVVCFLSISGRLRRPSLAPNVLYVIRKYTKIPRRYLGIVIICESVLSFTDCAIASSELDMSNSQQGYNWTQNFVFLETRNGEKDDLGLFRLLSRFLCHFANLDKNAYKWLKMVEYFSRVCIKRI